MNNREDLIAVRAIHIMTVNLERIGDALLNIGEVLLLPSKDGQLADHICLMTAEIVSFSNRSTHNKS